MSYISTYTALYRISTPIFMAVIILLAVILAFVCVLYARLRKQRYVKEGNTALEDLAEALAQGDFDKLYEIKNSIREKNVIGDQYETVLELAEVGVMKIDVENERCYISNVLCKMLGTDKHIFTKQELAELVHPDDDYVFDVRAYKTDEFNGNNVNQLELRIKADNGYHWFHVRYTKTFNNGKPIINAAMIDISDLKEKDAMIEKMAVIDSVTQIYNRNRFLELGTETFERAKKQRESYWLIILDFDKFHIINDTFGYKTGNRLLKDFAKELIRLFDTSSFCARIGGDNFAVIFRNDGNDDAPKQLFDKLTERLRVLGDEKYHGQTITVSGGYCRLPEDGVDFTEILEHAEFALRLGQHSRSNFSRYHIDAHNKILAGNALENELEKAIENNELKLYYQPKFNLESGRIIGMEALVRWVKPDGEVVMPGTFIPVAENSMLITKISRFVIMEACRQNKEWHDMGFDGLSVSVNISSVDFYQTDVCALIRNALNETGLEAEYLEIELTETLALKDVEKAIKQMLIIRDVIGARISMDDFGTGYSSLSYIQVLPISLLKLDRSFISRIEEDAVSREIVSSVVSIAKSKKIETIAEGIETEHQADILKKTGCDHAQGYFFGKPMPADKLLEFLNSYSKVKSDT